MGAEPLPLFESEYKKGVDEVYAWEAATNRYTIEEEKMFIDSPLFIDDHKSLCIYLST